MVGIAKNTTAPTHMTTPYSVELTKRFSSPHRKPPSRWPNLLADQAWAVQPHHRYHASEPNGAKWSPHRISKPDKIAI